MTRPTQRAFISIVAGILGAVFVSVTLASLATKPTFQPMGFLLIGFAVGGAVWFWDWYTDTEPE